MREIGLETANVSKVFDEIDVIATNCKFNDCKHKNEPGCAVIKAIDDGLISKERLSSYQKLQKEVSYNGLNSKQVEKVKIKKMFAEFDGIKNAKNFAKSKNTIIK
jgi:ribosome biogenesis GTPase